MGFDFGQAALGSAFGGVTGGAIGGFDLDPIGFLSGRSGISKAGDLSQQGFMQGIGGLQDFIKTLSPMYQPYQQMGTQALQQLQSPGGIQMAPGFQFQMQQGLDTMNQQASSRGHFFAPQTMEALTAYGQNMGQQGYQQQFQNLMQQVGMGFSATQGLTGQQSSIQQMISDLLMGKGKDAAQSEMAKTQGMQDLVKGGISAATSMFSDRKLKKNIKRIGTHILGIGIYLFDYIWNQPGIGFMADEVEEIRPEAVSEIGGFKLVNYAMLD